jgi:hypothetical protein
VRPVREEVVSMPRVPWRRNGSEGAAAAAERLVAEGRIPDAIEFLSEANRARRDRAIERRLVQLRSDAFLGASWSNQRPAWPESVPDLFPGVAVPELTGLDLSVECLRSAMRHHGVLLVRGLLDREHVDVLIDDVERALAAYDARTDGVKQADVDGWYEPFERGGVTAKQKQAMRKRGSLLTVESPPTMFDLLETFDEVGVSRLVREYFGEQPTLLARKGTLRRISHGGNTGGWHQDGAFMGADIRSLNIWLALSHCGDDAPGLDIVARRLTGLVQVGDGAFAEWAASPDAAEDAAAGALVRPIFDAGDALIFDHLNLHRTAIDPGMDHDRYAIETWLFSPSTYEGMTAGVEDGYSPRDQIPILL